MYGYVTQKPENWQTQKMLLVYIDVLVIAYKYVITYVNAVLLLCFL